jgi:hypothetical protein
MQFKNDGILEGICLTVRWEFRRFLGVAVMGVITNTCTYTSIIA